MNYSVANKKYKKYQQLLDQDPKNKLFNRKLAKYDLLRHESDPSDEKDMRGGARGKKNDKRKVKGFRVMTGGDINFETEPQKIENENLKKKDQITSENKAIVEQVTDKLNKGVQCEQNKGKDNEQANQKVTAQLATKTRELEDLQAAHLKLQQEKNDESSFKAKCDELETKVSTQLEELKAEIEKLKAEKSTLQANAEKYVGKVQEENKNTVEGLEQIIVDYHASMENLKKVLGIKTD